MELSLHGFLPILLLRTAQGFIHCAWFINGSGRIQPHTIIIRPYSFSLWSSNSWFCSFFLFNRIFLVIVSLFFNFFSLVISSGGRLSSITTCGFSGKGLLLNSTYQLIELHTLTKDHLTTALIIQLVTLPITGVPKKDIFTSLYI